MTTFLPSACGIALAVALSLSTLAGQIDLEAARAELDKTLVRPANTVIGEPQRLALAAFLARYEGQDLGPLGYARALQLYLQRDSGSADALDAFFAQHATIENVEHRTMAGRIYLGAIAGAARADKLDEVQLRQRASRAASLYHDLATMARVTAPLLAAGSSVQDRAALRTALLRGACNGNAGDAALDVFAASLYAASDAPEASPGGVRRAPSTNARATPAPADLDGQSAPAWTATHVIDPPLQGERVDKLTLTGLRGKVVVLHFWATWCPPCRAVVPHLVELQGKHKADLAVVGVTRFYGRGMDFSAPDASKPHGGKSVSELSEAAELTVNAAFATAFALNYPIAFIDSAVAATSYHVSSIPTVFVLDREGRVVGSVVGGNAQSVDELVGKALASRGR